MKNKEEVSLILKELQEDLIRNLNEYDPSVGLYPVNNLMDWSKDAFDGDSDISVITGNKTNLTFKFKGYLFEIYENVIQVGEEEYDFSWGIREYASTEETVS